MPQLIQPAYNFRTLTSSIDTEAMNCIEIKAHFGDLYITPAVSKKSVEEIRAKYKLSDPLYLEAITPKDSYLFLTVQYFFERYFMELFYGNQDFTAFDKISPFSLDIGYRITLSKKNGILGEIRASSITFVDNARTLIGCFGSLTFLKIPFFLTPFRTIGLGIMNEVYGGFDSGPVRISLDILPAMFLETEAPLSISRDIIYSFTTKLLFIYEKDYFFGPYDSSSNQFPMTIYSGLRIEF